MDSPNIDYYEKIKNLQDHQYASEHERMQLEHELGRYWKSDARISKLKASKLQHYWQKLCEDEEKSKVRNEQLVRDFARVESQVAALSARTERLRVMKQQYADYIERMYPRWKEQVLIQKAQQKELELQQAQAQAQARLNPTMLNASHGPLQVSNYTNAAATHPQPAYGMNPTYSSPYSLLHIPMGAGQEPGIGTPHIQPMNAGPGIHANGSYGNSLSTGQNLTGIPGATPYLNTGHTTNGVTTGTPYGNTGPAMNGVPGSNPYLNTGHTTAGTPYLNVGHTLNGVPGGNPYLHTGHAPGGGTPYVNTGPTVNGLPITGGPFENGNAYGYQLGMHPQFNTAQVHTGISPQTGQQVQGNPLHSAGLGGGAQNLDMYNNQQGVTHTDQVILGNHGHQTMGSAPPTQATQIHPPVPGQQPAQNGLQVPSDITRANSTNSSLGISPIPTKDVTPRQAVAHVPPGPSLDDFGDDSFDSDAEKPTPRVQANTIPKASPRRQKSKKSLSRESSKGDLETPRTAMITAEVQATVANALHLFGDNSSSPIPSANPPPSSQDTNNPRTSTLKEGDLKVISPDLQGADEESDFGSDVSIPLSHQDEDEDESSHEKHQGPASPRSPEPDTPRSQETTLNRTFEKSPEVRPLSSTLTTQRPEVTLEAFYLMLKLVQEDFLETFTPEAYYRSHMPAPSVRKEIIYNANNYESMNHVDCPSISMVLLEQLPLVVRNCQAGSLLTDKMLNAPIPVTSEGSIRGHIYSSDLELWDKIMDHFTQMLKHQILPAREIAELFTPLLMEESSQQQDKAINVITTILGNTTLDDTGLSNTSSISIPSPPLTPPKKPTVVITGVKAPKASKAPAAVEDSESEDEEEEDFFDKPTPRLEENSLRLTETAAYKSLLGGGASQKIPDNLDDDSDSDSDDIEKQLTSNLSPRGGQTTGNRSLGGTASLGISYATTEDLSESRRTATPSSSGASSPSRSPSPGRSPSRSGGGYMPSAMEQTGKSTLSFGSTARSTMTGNKKVFNLSDLDSESDIEIPMGKGPAKVPTAQEEDKDEFDFYD